MRFADFIIKTTEGEYDAEVYIRLIGQNLLVAIWGGDAPHIGAVSVAQPRPSLKDTKTTSATASVICLLGHKEDEVAKAASEVLAAALNAQVVVVAGIHWDNIDEEGIQKLIRNVGILLDGVLERICSAVSLGKKE